MARHYLPPDRNMNLETEVRIHLLATASKAETSNTWAAQTTNIAFCTAISPILLPLQNAYRCNVFFNALLSYYSKL